MKNNVLWIRLFIANFFIVAVLGLIMRYNILYPIDFVEHKFFREAHSHFAFYAWITGAIYFFIVKNLKKNIPNLNEKKYRILMIINQISSFGMLFSFMYRGYFGVSIAFSSLALFTGFAFFFCIVKDTFRIQITDFLWYRIGGFFAFLSSIGVFSLAYLMSHKIENDVLHRASIYFYLHFQYNGFFLFSCIGLLLAKLRSKGFEISKKNNILIFSLLFIGSFFGYGLSLLWIEKIPIWVNGILGIVALAQLYGGFFLIKIIFQQWKNLSSEWEMIQKTLLVISGIVFLLKLFLQSVSALPIFAPIFSNYHLVIAYLHLIFLMGFSLFLLFQITDLQIVRITKKLSQSILLLIVGITLNEIILGISGIYLLPNLWGQKLLILASLIIVISLFLIFISLKFDENPQ